MPTPTTRLAPSPTGAMHLGNARTFLINWAIARQAGQRVFLRIEDLDSPRVRPGANQQLIEDLTWLGIDWDGEPLYQRHDLSAYTHALDRLAQQGLIYPCTCTRRDILIAQSAPHDEHDLRYPGTCRPGSPAQRSVPTSPPLAPTPPTDTPNDTPTAWRLIVPDETIVFHDRFHGPQRINVQQQAGDFVVAMKSNLPAYQLVVVVDDARQGVTHVVRGDDLIPSTARQLLLYRMLKLGPIPDYLHLPLVLGVDGRRLAKRHGDTRLAWYRQQGVPPARVLGLIARWCGLLDGYEAMTRNQFLDLFDPQKLPQQPAVFTPEDHQWLINGSSMPTRHR